MARAKPPAARQNAMRKMLTVEHYDMIQTTLDRLAQLPEFIEWAELCDTDCKAFREAQAYYTDKLLKIKQKAFPQGRPK